jgi:energy-coupling factor transporter ATP-binding protein EcfA2
MSRKDDLERNIRESYDLIRKDEEIIRLSDRPKEQRRARREIEEQWGLIAGYLAEYRGLVRGALPDEIAQIAHRLSTLGIELPAARERPPQVPCPYRGLEPFEAEHAACYYGRQVMVTRLVEKVRDGDFVAVVGPSGCGKSSLLRAGLIATLREGALPGSPEWAVHLLRPGADPLRALAAPLVALLEPEASEVDRLAEARKLAGHLREGTVAMADVAARIRERHPTLPRTLLIADQFEELYTECRDEALQQAFIAALLDAAAEERIAVILALRADFYGRALADRRLGEAVDDRLVNVPPMGEEELRAAIEQPALRAGRRFEPGLVERILGDVAGEPGNLPLLEFALTGLWEQQAADGTLTHKGYEAIGQVEGAISQRAEDAYAELERQGREQVVHHLLLRLTHYGEGEGTRRRATLDDLVTLRTPRQEVEPAVQALADARLLVTGQDAATRAAAVEVAHEALIRGWERLRRWLDEDRAFGLWREKLAAARRMWEEAGQDAGALLRSAPLAEAEGWLAERGEDLNEAERTFVQRSLALRKRRRLRQWIATAALILAAVLIAILWPCSERKLNARRVLPWPVNWRHSPSSTWIDSSIWPCCSASSPDRVIVTKKSCQGSLYLRDDYTPRGGSCERSVLGTDRCVKRGVWVRKRGLEEGSSCA